MGKEVWMRGKRGIRICGSVAHCCCKVCLRAQSGAALPEDALLQLLADCVSLFNTG